MRQQTTSVGCPASLNAMRETKLCRTRRTRIRSFAPPRRGAIMFLVLFMLVLFLAACAFSIDVAIMNLAKAEIRAATDSAAKAAVTELGLTEDINLARMPIKTGCERLRLLPAVLFIMRRTIMPCSKPSVRSP